MAITEGRHDVTRTRNVVPHVPDQNTGHVEQHRHPVDYVWAVVRLGLGWTFLWAFVDKLFGLGFATPAAKAWINGGSPTTGFLKGTKDAALGGFFGGLAGQPWVDWLFMAGLAGIGTALILGVGMRIAAATGGLLLVLMWAAELPLPNNPFLDEHIVYAVVLIGLVLTGAADTLGLGRRWSRTALVERFPILK
ncbi:hypothetical protein Sme01_58440 [Sphaerisporangium melleum]|uniref:DoxX family protein n=1 Tax=Sphaerisporangium melleum TaxID=321316 RepID=A0A917VLR9_9ACTN|nr:hypothetical protein [Sphaerisporangium melleum]GGK93865.1 hypothetical protein GCM10007964_40330 [Sphaerisporangium melleum]GII73368.1 hypothetical protein Sme01_58440 [Sphaerisporangium melleum]